MCVCVRALLQWDSMTVMTLLCDGRDGWVNVDRMVFGEYDLYLFITLMGTA